MKICAIFILLTVLCPGGCPVYDFDVKTIEQPSEFSNDLKLEADLNKEIAQGLLRIGKDMDSHLNPQKHFYYNSGDRKDYMGLERTDEANKDLHEAQQSSQAQHYQEDNDKKDDHTQYVNKETTSDDDAEDGDNTDDTNTIDNDSDVDADAETDDDDDESSTEPETKLQRYADSALIKAEPEIENFVGTNLFDSTRRNCFTSEDVALLTARKDFERLIPKNLPHSLLNDKAVSILMHYFYGGNQIVQRLGNDISKRFIEKAFYDTLGGYLKFHMLPVTKYSFYAGELNLKTVSNVVSLYQQCKTFLNTNGNGWKSPAGNILNELKSVHLGPLKVPCGAENGDGASSCARLDLTTVNNEAEDDQMIVSLPKLEAEDCDGYLGNIWLPFKRKHTFNLRSSKSAFVVVKFYEAVTRCYSFQSICQDTYNHKFKSWILENIQVHLSDEQFYPGLGAILKIYENLKRNKKAITYSNGDDNKENDFEDSFKDFRNLYLKENEMFDDSNWFTKTFGKRDDKERNDQKSDIDYNDIDDDIDFDDDEFVNDKDICPEKPFLLSEKAKLNKTQNEQMYQAKNTTQVIAMDQCKALGKPEDTVKDKYIQQENKDKSKEKDDEQINKDKQKELEMNKLKDKEKQKDKENENDRENDIGRGRGKQKEKQTSSITTLLRHWICLLLLLIIIILLILLCCVMGWKRKQKPIKICKEPEPEPEPIEECIEVPSDCFEPEPPPKEKKRRGLCGCFRSRKQEEDEEELIAERKRECTALAEKQRECKLKRGERISEEKSVERISEVKSVERIKPKPVFNEITDDDEVIVKPESSSVIATSGTTRCSSRSSSSSSTPMCQTQKCVPLFGKSERRPCPPKVQKGTAPKETRTPASKATVQKQTDKSDAAIIETTSMDYSSSDPDETYKTTMAQKNQPRAVTIDEKRRERERAGGPISTQAPTLRLPTTQMPTTSKSRNDKKAAQSQNDDALSSMRARIGLQRTSIADPDVKKKLQKSTDSSKRVKDKMHSTSWETMYDS